MLNQRQRSPSPAGKRKDKINSHSRNANEKSVPNVLNKVTSSGRIARISLNGSSPGKHRRSPVQSRHDTARTSTGLKKYPRPLSPNHRFKIGTQTSIARRCDSPLKSRILEIYKNFTPTPKNYKSVNPRWKPG
jgi:hypothetical protein